MNLYLMRHADAGLPRGNPALDAKRALIKDGKEQCMLMGRLLGRAQGAGGRHCLQSRSSERCKPRSLWVPSWATTPKSRSTPALAPGASYADFQQMLATYADREDVLAVGHNPNLFQFLGRVITGNGGAGVRMRKGLRGPHRHGQASAASAVAD